MNIITQNKRLVAIMLIATLLLAAPLIAMQFTNEVDWGLFDFIAAGVLLFGTGLTCEFILRKVKNKGLAIDICIVVLILLILVWAELAVGIFGTPFAGS